MIGKVVHKPDLIGEGKVYLIDEKDNIFLLLAAKKGILNKLFTSKYVLFDSGLKNIATIESVNLEMTVTYRFNIYDKKRILIFKYIGGAWQLTENGKVLFEVKDKNFSVKAISDKKIEKVLAQFDFVKSNVLYRVHTLHDSILVLMSLMLLFLLYIKE
ncbi:hypothetical protein [Desulfosediminicola sp.]|uniref:hypothetical protein n=1 Tax=Desulfosediminicola sp. TaxID=2886825 RepID=UPI003AF2723C